MIDIHYDNFETDLIGASMQVPVLLDIWAPWCGPCKQLGPVLEQLEQDYGGRFILAKLNADDVPEIASQLSQLFGVRSIPFCVMFVQGQPVDGFVGALPQAQIEAFLDKYTSGDVVDAAGDEPAPEDAPGDDTADTDPLAALAHEVAQRPQDEELRLKLVRALIERQQLDSALEVFTPLAPQARGPVPQARILAHARYLEALSASLKARPADELKAQLASQPRDFATRYELAQQLFGAGQFTQAMDELLEIIMRDKSWQDELARKTYVAILEVMSKPPEKPAPTAHAGGHPGAHAGHAGGHGAAGSAGQGKDKPRLEIAGTLQVQSTDPMAAVIDQYRRKLSMALF